MAQEAPIHSKLLTKAGRSILRPMGLMQKGRSRTWLDDRQWWVGVVEFQPSGWSRGSYLNVGCMWLWCMKSYISFDVGQRLESFVEFQSDEQFERAAAQLAQSAAHEVNRYRALFANIVKTCEYYSQQDLEDGWPCYHAAIASALANRFDVSHSMFQRVAECRGDCEWITAMQQDAKHLVSLVGTSQFREVIANRVCQTRALRKLPAVAGVNFD